MKKAMVIAVAVLALGGVSACEEAGENIDNALEEADGGPRDLTDGPMEKAGETVDNTLGVERTNDADSVADAVDGDRATDPQ